MKLRGTFFAIACALALGACVDDYSMRIDQCGHHDCTTTAAIGTGGAITFFVDHGDSLADTWDVDVTSSNPAAVQVTADPDHQEWKAVGLAPGEATLSVRAPDGQITDTMQLEIAPIDGIVFQPSQSTPAQGYGTTWTAQANAMLVFRASPLVAGQPSFGVHTYTVSVDGTPEVEVENFLIGPTYTEDMYFDVPAGPHVVSLDPRIGPSFTFDVTGQ